MERQDVFNFVYAYLRQKVFTLSILPESSSLRDDLGLDSLDELELILECEDKFGIRITDEETKNASSIGDFVTVIYNEIKKKY